MAKVKTVDRDEQDVRNGNQRGRDLWTRFAVTWRFLTRICGSTPADPALIKKWLDARQPRIRPAGGKSMQEIEEEVIASIERGALVDDEQASMLVFQRHQGAICMRYSTVRAHLKDCSRVLSNQFYTRMQGERAFSTRAINGIYLPPSQYWIPILRENGESITDADGREDRAIHVKGPRGEPLSALKNYEFIEPPSMMQFTLLVLGKSVTEDDLHTVMMYGGVHGYAGERSDGEGRYDFEIERIDG